MPDQFSIKIEDDPDDDDFETLEFVGWRIGAGVWHRQDIDFYYEVRIYLTTANKIVAAYDSYNLEDAEEIGYEIGDGVATYARVCESLPKAEQWLRDELEVPGAALRSAMLTASWVMKDSR